MLLQCYNRPAPEIYNVDKLDLNVHYQHVPSCALASYLTLSNTEYSLVCYSKAREMHFHNPGSFQDSRFKILVT